jgi:hypothetical protein
MTRATKRLNLDRERERLTQGLFTNVLTGPARTRRVSLRTDGLTVSRQRTVSVAYGVVA